MLQVQVCAEALKLHGSVCTAAMKALHEFMEEKYRGFRKKYGNPDDVRELSMDSANLIYIQCEMPTQSALSCPVCYLPPPPRRLFASVS